MVTISVRERERDITLENTKILSVEHKRFERGVKEAIRIIRALNLSLNRGRWTLQLNSPPQSGLTS